MYRFVTCALLLGALLSTTACGDDASTPTTPTPTTPPVAITDTFSGSINRNGAATHTFLAQARGTVTVTLTTLAPEGTEAIGLSLGTWNGTACQLVIANTAAAQGAVIFGEASSAGNLCVFVQDVGKIAAAASYEITVVHP
jgi:hypothetical protein